MRLLPPTSAVTSKFSGAPTPPPAPTTACDSPVPALDLAGQLALPPGLENSPRAHWVRPLPETLTVDGKSISIFEAVVPATLFLTNVAIFTALGFFLVPALDGASLVVASTSVFWATATEASAMEASAAIAAIRNLRKESPPQEMGSYGVRIGTGQEAPVARSLSADIETPPPLESFAC